MGNGTVYVHDAFLRREQNDDIIIRKTVCVTGV